MRIGALLLGFALLCAPLGCERGGAAAQPNIVVLLLDTLRPDHLGFYGYERETAPFLAELARRSAVFSEAHSTTGWTAPAVASLFTALYPARHGVIEGMRTQKLRARAAAAGEAELRVDRIPQQLATLPELLKRNGYRTFGISTNHNIGSEMGFTRGFDRFALLPRVPEHPATPRIPRRSMTAPPAGDVLESLIAWEGDIRSSRPFFLYLHLNDPHVPYHQRSPWYRGGPERLDQMRSAYDSEISYMDGVLRLLYERFAADDNTLLVVASDHGEELGERGHTSHAHGLHREVNRVLLMVSGPGLGVEPRVIHERVSLIDVAPTVLDFAGAPPLAGADGWSLRPLLTEHGGRVELERRTRERRLFAHRAPVDPTQPETWAVITERWKLIEEGDRGQLYERTSDPEERSDVAARHPTVVAELRRNLQAFRDAAPAAPAERVSVPLDADRFKELEALGYVE